MTRDPSTSTPDGIRITWSTVGQTLTRPYPVTIPMVLLVSLVPFYLVIAGRARGSAVHAPALALDRLLPLAPTWALVYGVLYAFLIVLPVFVVQQEELIRRTGWAFLYDADPPYNCFPSLHVAHSFVSALAGYRVHRTLGFVAISCASLVAISTLFTKQHYVADLIAGILLALGAYAVFLRGHSRANVPQLDRRVAPFLALVVAGIVGLGFACYWVAYRLGVQA